MFDEKKKIERSERQKKIAERRKKSFSKAHGEGEEKNCKKRERERKGGEGVEE